MCKIRISRFSGLCVIVLLLLWYGCCSASTYTGISIGSSAGYSSPYNDNTPYDIGNISSISIYSLKNIGGYVLGIDVGYQEVDTDDGFIDAYYLMLSKYNKVYTYKKCNVYTSAGVGFTHIYGLASVSGLGTKIGAGVNVNISGNYYIDLRFTKLTLLNFGVDSKTKTVYNTNTISVGICYEW